MNDRPISGEDLDRLIGAYDDFVRDTDPDDVARIEAIEKADVFFGEDGVDVRNLSPKARDILARKLKRIISKYKY